MGGDLYNQEQLPLTFSFSFIIYEEVFSLENPWLHLQPMGLDLWEKVLAPHPQVMMR